MIDSSQNRRAAAIANVVARSPAEHIAAVGCPRRRLLNQMIMGLLDRLDGVMASLCRADAAHPLLFSVTASTAEVNRFRVHSSGEQVGVAFSSQSLSCH